MFNTPRPEVRKRIPPPCYGCEDRRVGCHGSCEKYTTYKKAALADYIAIKRAYEGERIAEAFGVESRVNAGRKLRQKQGGYKRRWQ